MPIYLVLPTHGKEAILTRAKSAGVDLLHEPFKEGGFMVNFQGTPEELGKTVGIYEANPAGQGIIVPVAGHFGYANTQIWTWMKSRKEKNE